MNVDRPEKSLPTGADGDNSIYLDNGQYSVDVGETESGTWVWQFDGHTTLYHEYFAMQDESGNDRSVVPSYKEGPLKRVEDFPNTGEPGEQHQAVMKYVVGNNILAVKRTVKLAIDKPTLIVKYDIKNDSVIDDSKDETVDLDFFQYADFDDGSSDFWDDIAYYDDAAEMVYTRDRAGGAYSGFTTNKSPKNHHVGEYPGYWAVNNDQLNNDDKFPDSGSDDPVVAMEWDLGELEPGESTSITVQFGAETTFTDLEQNIENPPEIPTDPPLSSSIRGSATVLSYAPALNENSNYSGNRFHAVFPNKAVSPVPLLKMPQDGAYFGDHVTSPPKDLVEFLSMRKEVDGLNEVFRNYRVRNSVKVEFDPDDGGTIDGGVTVNTNVPEDNWKIEIGDNVDAEVETFLHAPSHTVVHEEMVDKSYPNLVGNMVQNDADRSLRAHTRKRFLTVTKSTMNDPDGGEIDAVTVSALYGSENPYTRALVNATGFNDVPIAEELVQDNPRIYTWIELTVGADGTRVVRVPDASVFPKHLGYVNRQSEPPEGYQVNGRREDQNGLEVLYDTSAESGDGYDVAVNEQTNNVWNKFKGEVEAGNTPYASSHLLYYLGYSDENYAHPVMLYGAGTEGESLSKSECRNRLTNEFPQSPFPALLGISEVVADEQ
ncbi:hypothetical protein [Haloparvum sp. PAK95]|uniref:hypothetical protein n=1 Tax=Haloparvum sp. PAK95 TaxID=3418962 RepID=UPI003D2F3655